MIRSVADFIRYFEGVRRRTWVAVDCVTPALVGWRPRQDEWSCGAIIRHLAGAERFFVARVVDDRWTEDLDPGPECELAATRALLADAHAREMAVAHRSALLRRAVRGRDGRGYRSRLCDRVRRARVDHEPVAAQPCAGSCKRARRGGGRVIHRDDLPVESAFVAEDEAVVKIAVRRTAGRCSTRSASQER